ncbi:MAG: hypothetical protein JW939_04215, partial [Candidatus Thermoplasmatota archaeon]|nr:hypothetical protein [Candidatus Thermoplasmatota archaeon]
AEPGRHDIEVVIDPENSIIERHDQFTDGGASDNNVARTVIEVEGGHILKDLVSENPVLGTVLIMLLSVLALCGVALIMRGKRTLPSQHRKRGMRSYVPHI